MARAKLRRPARAHRRRSGERRVRYDSPTALAPFKQQPPAEDRADAVGSFSSAPAPHASRAAASPPSGEGEGARLLGPDAPALLS